MSKIKFVKHPRSIVRKRPDYPSSLFVTIPKKMVEEWMLGQGQLVEFSILVDGHESYLKLKKVQAV